MRAANRSSEGQGADRGAWPGEAGEGHGEVTQGVW